MLNIISIFLPSTMNKSPLPAKKSLDVLEAMYYDKTYVF